MIYQTQAVQMDDFHSEWLPNDDFAKMGQLFQLN